jgi:hypothetical protein
MLDPAMREVCYQECRQSVVIRLKMCLVKDITMAGRLCVDLATVLGLGLVFGLGFMSIAFRCKVVAQQDQ